MSAEILREAAALMRERATVDGPPSPWRYATHPAYEGDDDWHMSEHHVRYVAELGGYECRVADVWHQDVAEHIASWHPVVALAVADWLDVLSDGEWPYCDCGDEGCNYGPCIAQRRAITVARAYLGSAS